MQLYSGFVKLVVVCELVRLPRFRKPLWLLSRGLFLLLVVVGAGHLAGVVTGDPGWQVCGPRTFFVCVLGPTAARKHGEQPLLKKRAAKTYSSYSSSLAKPRDMKETEPPAPPSTSCRLALGIHCDIDSPARGETGGGPLPKNRLPKDEFPPN